MLCKRVVKFIVAAAVLAVAAGPVIAASPLDPNLIPQYKAPLVIPPTMPRSLLQPIVANRLIDYYEIAVRQFRQQVLPPGMPATTVWGYGSVNHPDTFSWPTCTIEATTNRPVRIKWINGLVDRKGNYLPHLLDAVDQTLHWANPPGGEMGKDMHGTSQEPYKGPVPLVAHLHGAHVQPDSDGYPTAWYLPNAKNIPAGYARYGTDYKQFDNSNTDPGTAVYQYPNDQAACTLWFHDHTLGMTRANVYAGPVGFYLIRGGKSDLPCVAVPSGQHEIPLVIQDRSFNDDGSLFYPDNRAFFEGLAIDQFRVPFTPDAAVGGPSDIHAIWNPEVFGNTMVVNGTTWPALKVEACRYRFRVLNGCNSRTMIVKLVTGDPTVRPATAAMPFWQIGTEGGFLPAPVQRDSMLLGPAERVDVIVDFGRLAPGTAVYLINEGPDEPFGGGTPGVDFASADPATTGQVMKFVVTPRKVLDLSIPPSLLKLPKRTPLPPASITRQISFNELDSSTVFVRVNPDGSVDFDPTSTVPWGPAIGMLGTLNPDGTGNPLLFDDPVTETPKVGTTEIWEIHDFTADAHPFHVHLVQFDVVNREDANGVVRPPDAWETGPKDTILVYPGEILRVKATFDKVGRYIWHCHILEHEDNEMMRPYDVVP